MRRVALVDFARDVRVNRNTLGRVINGFIEPWPALRRRSSEVLGAPEEELWS